MRVALVARGWTASDFLRSTEKFDAVWAITYGSEFTRERTTLAWTMHWLDVMRNSLNANKPRHVRYVVEECAASGTPVMALEQECPHWIAYPIEEVRAHWADNPMAAHCLDKSTVCYALAYADMIGVSDIHLFGVDGGDNPNFRGMASAIMLGLLSARGVRIHLSPNSILGQARTYGYDPDGGLPLCDPRQLKMSDFQRGVLVGPKPAVAAE